MHLIVATLKRCAVYFVWIVMIVSILVLSGRIIGFFTGHAMPEIINMDPISASAFLLLAFNFLLRYSQKITHPAKATGVLMILLIIMACLARYFFDFSFLTNISWMGDNEGAVVLTPITAICFLCCGIALVAGRKNYYILQSIAAVVWILTFFTSLVHAYHVPEFQDNSFPFFTMPVPIVACFALLSTALLLVESNSGWVKLFTTDFEGARVAQLLVPTAFGSPVFLGYLRLWLSRNYSLSTEFGVTLLVTATTTLFSVVVWYTIVKLDNRDKARRKNESSLLILNRKLQDSRSETAHVNEELQAANEELYSSNEALLALNEQLAKASAKIEEQSKIIILQQEKNLNFQSKHSK